MKEKYGSLGSSVQQNFCRHGGGILASAHDGRKFIFASAHSECQNSSEYVSQIKKSASLPPRGLV